MHVSNAVVIFVLNQRPEEEDVHDEVWLWPWSGLFQSRRCEILFHTCQPIQFTSIKYIKESLFWGDILENEYRKT